MSDKKIILAYGTRFGSTKEVSEELASLFGKKGCDASLLDLVETPMDLWPSPDSHDGVIVGSSIRRGQWMDEPKSYLKKNKTYWGGKILLGVFVCCATAAKPELRSRAKNEYIEAVLKDLNIRADMVDAFGGIIDFSETSKQNWIDKKIIGRIHKNDPAVRKNIRNDLRDWDQIRSFGEEFCGLLNNKTLRGI